VIDGGKPLLPTDVTTYVLGEKGYSILSQGYGVKK
jgi:hypothetical protein